MLVGRHEPPVGRHNPPSKAVTGTNSSHVKCQSLTAKEKSAFSNGMAVLWRYNERWVASRIQRVLGDGYFDITIVDRQTVSELGREKVFGINGSRIVRQDEQAKEVYPT